jgi:LacI family transcriptional regulator
MERKKRSRVTLQQVAKHAGVSRATASLVARNSSLIAEKTRKKVLKSMSELGYIYDRVAANLRSKSSSTVGLIITEIANPYFAELLAGVHQSLDRDGYTVILGTTLDSNNKQDQLLSTMLENRVGGIILSPVSAISEDSIVRIREWDIPIVMIAREAPGVNCDYVGVDNVLGAQIAINHLIQKGHHRISFLGGPSESSAWKNRKKGYRLALEQAGVEFDESLLLNTPATREGGREGVRRMFKNPNPPTAIFCYNDVVAFGVMSGLREIGLTPGKDVAVVGFDNIQEAAQSNPALTTVSAFPKRIGTLAADLLHQHINGLEREPQKIILMPELVVRESSNRDH